MKTKPKRRKPRPDQLDSLFIAAEYFEAQNERRTAFDCLLAGALGGHLFCQEGVAVAYSEGAGVRRDAQQAAYWYRRAHANAIRQGAISSVAAHNYGIDLYSAGKSREAVKWFEKARAQKDASAMIWLAKIALEGKDARGRNRAVQLLEEALAMKVYAEISEMDRQKATEMLAKLTRKR